MLCVAVCEILFVMYGSMVFSRVLVNVERIELDEVPMLLFSFVFGMGIMLIELYGCCSLLKCLFTILFVLHVVCLLHYLSSCGVVLCLGSVLHRVCIFMAVPLFV